MTLEEFEARGRRILRLETVLTQLEAHRKKFPKKRYLGIIHYSVDEMDDWLMELHRLMEAFK